MQFGEARSAEDTEKVVCTYRLRMAFLRGVGIPALLSASSIGILLILSKALSQSSSTNNNLIVALSPDSISLLTMWIAWFVLLVFLNPYCVDDSSGSIPSDSLLCKIVA